MEGSSVDSGKIKLRFANSKIPKDLSTFVDFLTPTLKKMQSSKDYETPFASLDLVEDESNLKKCREVEEKVSSLSVLIVIGIGGSNLGTMAVYEAMKAKNKNLKELIFADTTDSFLIEDIIEEMKQLHAQGEEIGINVVTKSGTTTETIANFYILYEALGVILSNENNEQLHKDNEEDKSEKIENKNSQNDKENSEKGNSNKEDEVGSIEEGEKNFEGNENEINEEASTKNEVGNDIENAQKLSLNERVIITTDKGSKLELVANLKGFHILPIPQLVGGRYSVLSNVGLFPLSFAGVECGELLRGAKDIKHQCMKINDNNPALMSASAIYNSYKQDKKIVNMFLFSKYLNNLGAWYRQLFAESLGKKMNANNSKEVRSGMMPMYSIGSTDLHSVAQLFLGGPNMTYHSFVTIENTSMINFTIPQGFESLIPSIENKTLDDIMKAIYGGVEKAFINENISFDNFHIKELDEYSIGALMQFKMIEVMLLGSLFGVNPFDQPSVELYKQETRKLIGE